MSLQNMRPFTYTLRQGESLRQLSLRYQTSVDSILARNPHLDPRDLRAGTSIMICPGETTAAWRAPPVSLPRDYGCLAQRPAPRPPARGIICPTGQAQAPASLSCEMREAWGRLVRWQRMLLLSIAERLEDLSAVEDRLMQTPGEIARLFGQYYGEESAGCLEQLLTEHLELGGNLITAQRNGQTAQANAFEEQWYENAGRLADTLSGIQPQACRGEMRDTLRRHLDRTAQQVSARLAGDYTGDIQAYDQVERGANAMADDFTDGIMRQFR